MDFVLKGLGIRITDQMRNVTKNKLSKLGRVEPRVTRLEVRIIGEHNPRIDGNHRVEVTCDTARRVFRANGSGHDVDSALDQVVTRLERQIASYRGKLLHRRQRGPIA
jgi:ribosomal subunit interface protein